MNLTRLCLATILISLNLAVAGPVTLSDSGSSVTLANGIVSLVVQKNDGRITAFNRIGGPNLVGNTGNAGMYFDANLTVDTNSLYTGIAPGTYTIVTNTVTRVEIMIRNQNFGKPAGWTVGAFDVELHFSLNSTDSGFYSYNVWRHGAGKPATSLGQTRTVTRTDPNLFASSASATRYAFSSTNNFGQSRGVIPGENPQQIADATTEYPPGTYYTNAVGSNYNGMPVYSKYDWSDLLEHHTAQGYANNTNGIWLIHGSLEYYNGGPMKGVLLDHWATNPLMINEFQGGHFGGAAINLATNEVWEKVYGPYFVYANAGTNHSQLWQDALARGQAERAAWPCTWVNNGSYPVARGQVGGTLTISGQSTSNALLVLGQPGSYWHYQSRDYLFWTRANSNGQFTIPAVRPGTYSLFARVPGVFGEFELTNVIVTANQTNNLGALAWTPPQQQQTLWRIGSPDLTTAGFRFADRKRQLGLWFRYLEERGTNDLNFVVGQSLASNDWYYAQCVTALGSSNDTSGIYVAPKWNVIFNLSNTPPQPAVLKLDHAGQMHGAFNVYVNGTSLAPNPVTGFYHENDGGIYRDAVECSRAKSYVLPFDANLLQPGTNVITFTVRAAGSVLTWNGTKPSLPSAGVMYDAIELSAGVLLPPGRYLTWRGGVSGNAWDIGTTANWLSNGVTTTFADGDHVTFDNSASNNLSIALASVLSPGSVTVNAGSNFTFGGAGGLAGSMTLDKFGAGTVTLNTTSTYTGTTTLAAGKIVCGTNSPLGTGMINFAGGTLQLLRNGTLANPLHISSGSSLLNNGNNSLDGNWSGPGLLTAGISINNVITVNGDTKDFTGTLSLGTSPGAVRFNQGGGTWGMSNAIVDAGTLGIVRNRFTSGGTIYLGGLAGGSGSKLQASDQISNAGSINTYVIGGANQDTTFAGAMADTAHLLALRKIGTGTLTLSGPNSYSGLTAVSAGALQVLGQINTTNLIVVSNSASLNLGGSLTAGLTRIESGGLLTGCGTINGPLVNHGTMLLNCGMGQQLVVNGSFTNHGTLQLLAGTAIAVSGSFVNHGTIDLITSPNGLPPGLINNGVIINSSSVVIQSIDLTDGEVVIAIQTVANHGYQLQRSPSLGAPVWTDIGSQEPGNGSVVTLVDSPAAQSGQFFYRVLVAP
jgi:rhamnogalacturonan endolyase